MGRRSTSFPTPLSPRNRVPGAPSTRHRPARRCPVPSIIPSETESRRDSHSEKRPCGRRSHAAGLESGPLSGRRAPTPLGPIPGGQPPRPLPVRAERRLRQICRSRRRPSPNRAPRPPVRRANPLEHSEAPAFRAPGTEPSPGLSGKAQLRQLGAAGRVPGRKQSRCLLGPDEAPPIRNAGRGDCLASASGSRRGHPLAREMDDDHN